MTDCLEYKGNTFYFHIGERHAARELVLKYHYSGRCHENPILVGSLHFGGGGLYGDKGELVFFLYLIIIPGHSKKLI